MGCPLTRWAGMGDITVSSLGTEAARHSAACVGEGRMVTSQRRARG
jgi:hypothetical protein